MNFTQNGFGLFAHLQNTRFYLIQEIQFNSLLGIISRGKPP